MTSQIARFIRAAGIPAESQIELTAFGDSPATQTQLAELVIAGTKRATTSLLRSYHDEHEALPQPGKLFVVLDGTGKPRCLCRTVRVETRVFAEVDATFAQAEGEGDLTLAYWRATHRAFFEREGLRAGFSFRADQDVVLEHFELLYVPDANEPPGSSS